MLTHDAFAAIRKLARGDHPQWQDAINKQQHGLFPIMLTDDTYDRLQGMSFEHETVSETIIRVASIINGSN